ncbi:nuclear transport factor 2 family protein [Actinophytocola sp.]|uniref:nuclear transport factor 2 family protein n=1 Tax=Actinophytocola sp. TaxID=1872138 RepID=UPI0025C18E46|nr:nuclear transport factor 2 family protein [Actinophytocola sp.]
MSQGTSNGVGAAAAARAFLDAFAGKDTDAALALLTDDVVWHVDGAPEVPTVGLLQGRARVKEWIEGFPDAFEPRGFRLSPIIDGGTEAIVPGWFRYLVRTTQRTVEGDFTMRFTVRDGLISHYQIYEDSLALALAFAADLTGPPGSQRLRVNDIVYGYDDVGCGPVVLFLSGRDTDRSVFAAHVLALQDRYRCVSLDLPGRGATTLPPEGWTPRGVADDLALMIREKGWLSATIVGHAHDAPVGTELATRHPGLVGQLALLPAGDAVTDASVTDASDGPAELLADLLRTGG